MDTSIRKPDPGAKAPPMMHEGDIGSGEITPGQQETNEMIKEIPPLHGRLPEGDVAGKQPEGSGKP
jgi:hypothetical protein